MLTAARSARGVLPLLLGVVVLGGVLACAPASPPQTAAAASDRAASAAPAPGLLDGTWADAWSLGGPPEASRAPVATAPVAPPERVPQPSTTAEERGRAAGGRASDEPRRRRVVGLPTGIGDQAAPPVAAPQRVRVPRLGIDSSLDRLGLRRDGELQAPPRWGTAGWFTDAARPGERGPAVIAGHLDSPGGPAVFAQLPAIRRGDRVVVTDVAGSRHTFAVQRVTRTPKVGFPTEAVYGSVPGSELRLITCTGSYVPGNGGYQDNLLVFATLVRG